MNYLAHLYLSGDNAQLAVGNFIADSVKGNDHENFSSEIQKGILLHRKIDEFTDHHPLVHQSKQHFVKQFDKYSGVLIDVFYDHILAKGFSNYSTYNLHDYAAIQYKSLLQFHHLFPEKSKAFYSYMTQYNILEAYSTIEGLTEVLKGLTRRINNRFQLTDAIPIFMGCSADLESDFIAFFSELKAYVNSLNNIH